MSIRYIVIKLYYVNMSFKFIAIKQIIMSICHSDTYQLNFYVNMSFRYILINFFIMSIYMLKYIVIKFLGHLKIVQKKPI